MRSSTIKMAAITPSGGGDGFDGCHHKWVLMIVMDLMVWSAGANYGDLAKTDFVLVSGFILHLLPSGAANESASASQPSSFTTSSRCR